MLPRLTFYARARRFVSAPATLHFRGRWLAPPAPLKILEVMMLDRTSSTRPTGLIDAAAVGFDAALHFPSTPPSFKDIVARLRESKYDATPQSKRNVKSFAQLAVLVGDEGTGTIYDVITVRLHLRSSATGVVTTSQTLISFNLQKLLAADQPKLRVSQLSYTGDSNMVAFEGQHPSNLERQLQLAGEAAACAKIVLEELFPEAEWSWNRTYAKVAELCWDRQTRDPISSGRLMQQATLNGATAAARQSYKRGVLEDGGVPTVFQERVQRGERLKVYAKAPQRLRCEVACPHRDALKELVGRSSAPFTAEGVSGLYAEFVEAAAPRLATIIDQTEQVLNGTVSVVPLLMALYPLLRVAAAERKDRGPAPNAESVALATKAVEELLHTSKTDLRGQRREHVVPRVFEEMREAGAVSRHPSSLIYYLNPALVRGAFEICHARTVWDDDPDTDHTGPDPV